MAQQTRFTALLMRTWLNIVDMCYEADKAGLNSELIKLYPYRNAVNTTFALSVQYWVADGYPLQAHTFMATVYMEISHCEGMDLKQAQVQFGKGQELLLVLNRIQYILAYALNKPAEEVEKYRSYIEKSMEFIANQRVEESA